jgi:ABC-type phosphate transport system substrate-binding protein
MSGSNAMSRALILAVLLVAAIGVLPAQAADVVVIIHPQVGVDHLSLAELRRIYRKEKTEWPGGEAIIPFDHAGTPDVRKAFCRKVLGATVSEVQNFWINKRMTAGIAGPKAFKSETLVKRFVANTPGGIGYIAPDEVDDTVKVVAIDGW